MMVLKLYSETEILDFLSSIGDNMNWRLLWTKLLADKEEENMSLMECL